MDPRSPIARHASSPADLKARIEAERVGTPFLLYRDDFGAQVLVTLPPNGSMTVGRLLDNDVVLAWDGEVSRVHAKLELVGREWTLVDDGLSRNGSWVNGQRVRARRRLRDGDALRFGNTVIAFLQPGDRESDATQPAAETIAAEELTDTQRRILLALARPFKDPNGLAMPATNKAIAAEVFLSVEAVKSHLRTLFHKFAVEDLPQNQKRLELVWRAFRSGAISATDLWS